MPAQFYSATKVIAAWLNLNLLGAARSQALYWHGRLPCILHFTLFSFPATKLIWTPLSLTPFPLLFPHPSTLLPMSATLCWVNCCNVNLFFICWFLHYVRPTLGLVVCYKPRKYLYLSLQQKEMIRSKEEEEEEVVVHSDKLQPLQLATTTAIPSTSALSQVLG